VNKPDRHLAFKGKECRFSTPNATNLKVKGKVTADQVALLVEVVRRRAPAEREVLDGIMAASKNNQALSQARR
jgi:hypothetical protein